MKIIAAVDQFWTPLSGRGEERPTTPINIPTGHAGCQPGQDTRLEHWLGIIVIKPYLPNYRTPYWLRLLSESLI